jgi:hypothetical protein
MGRTMHIVSMPFSCQTMMHHATSMKYQCPTIREYLQIDCDADN